MDVLNVLENLELFPNLAIVWNLEKNCFAFAGRKFGKAFIKMFTKLFKIDLIAYNVVVKSSSIYLVF